MIYHNDYIVESFSTTTKQNYYIYQVISKSGKTKRGLSWINNALQIAPVLKVSGSCWINHHL